MHDAHALQHALHVLSHARKIARRALGTLAIGRMSAAVVQYCACSSTCVAGKRAQAARRYTSRRPLPTPLLAPSHSPPINNTPSRDLKATWQWQYRPQHWDWEAESIGKWPFTVALLLHHRV